VAEKRYIMRSFIIYPVCQIVLRQLNQEDELGRACSIHGRDKKCIEFWSESLMGGTTWKI
jgi:hypothetical protein